MENPETGVTSESLKELGNKAVKDQNFKEAILHYTHAIKLDPQNFVLYSNRSHAYLKLEHYYFALRDAQYCIALSPNWPKGYFRKGEVEFATQHYSEAFESYREALRWKPEDANILKALNITAQRVLRLKDHERKVPWVGAGLGIIFGISLLIAECIFSRNPTNPLIMAVITVISSLIGYGFGYLKRAYVRHRRNNLLKPVHSENSEDSEEGEEEVGKEEIRRTPRYSKSQARLRYKKGKA